MSRKVTQEELEQHGGQDGSYWTVIHGKVYDFTAFVDAHPGGKKIITLAGGRDSTILFDSHHLEHSQTAVTHALEKGGKVVLVGEYAEATNEGDPSFFITLRRRVHERLKERRISSHHGSEWIIGEAVVSALLYLLVTYFVSVRASYAWAVVLGLLSGRLGFLMHSGNHASASKSRTWNVVVGLTMNLIGASSKIWRYQHQVSHHMFPNDPHWDKDCHSGKPFTRLHPQHPVYRWHWMNAVTTSCMMVGFSAKWYFSDIGRFFVPVLGAVKVRIHDITAWDWLGLLLTKGQWFFLHIYVPYHLHGLATTLKLTALFLGVASYYLGGTFIVNHIQEGLISDPKRHWAERQVQASANWAARSLFYNWASGGLNHQIEHHIFPSMSIYCYPHIQDVVEKTAKEFGLPYRNYPSFSNALFNTLVYLSRLGWKKISIE